MKSPYFTPAALDAETQALLDELGAQRRRGSPLQAARAALLVLDMQRYFLEPASHAFVPSAPAILPGVAALAAQWAGRGLPLFFTRHVNNAENAANMARWWRETLTAENPLSEITPELDTRQAMIITKSQYDAFYQTPLEELLRQRGVSQVIICGVMTHLCCETTARAAFVRGFEVFFTVDGTATYNLDFHLAALRNLAHGFATLVRVGEVGT